MNGTTNKPQHQKFAIRVAFLVMLAWLLNPAQVFADEALDSLKTQIKGLYGSFRANFTVSTANGMQSGKLMYQYPGKLRIEIGSGIVATNGEHLWVHNRNSSQCARQNVSGVGGGLLGLLGAYEGTVQGNTYIFKKKDSTDEIVIQVGGGMIRSVRMHRGDETTTYTFSSVILDAGISGAMFNYRPVGAQIVENPMNN